jgi:hypothetical protein
MNPAWHQALERNADELQLRSSTCITSRHVPSLHGTRLAGVATSLLAFKCACAQLVMVHRESSEGLVRNRRNSCQAFLRHGCHFCLPRLAKVDGNGNLVGSAAMQHEVRQKLPSARPAGRPVRHPQLIDQEPYPTVKAAAVVPPGLTRTVDPRRRLAKSLLRTASPLAALYTCTHGPFLLRVRACTTCHMRPMHTASHLERRAIGCQDLCSGCLAGRGRQPQKWQATRLRDAAPPLQVAF